MPCRGVDPLNTAKYILAAHSALDGGIFDVEVRLWQNAYPLTARKRCAVS